MYFDSDDDSQVSQPHLVQRTHLQQTLNEDDESEHLDELGALGESFQSQDSELESYCKAPAEADKNRSCPTCKAPVEAGKKFCGECGSPLALLLPQA